MKKQKRGFYSFWSAEWDGKNTWTLTASARLTADHYHTITQTVTGGKHKGTKRLCAALVRKAKAEFSAILDANETAELA